MKSLQYTLGISICLFLTITCKQDFYSKYYLKNSVPMSYSLKIKYISSTTCALLCLSTEGCNFFYWYNKSCYITKAASPVTGPVNVEYIYVHDDLKDSCNLDGYGAVIGGVLCVKVYYTRMNWTDAKTTCELDGGQLLVMRTSVFYLKMEALKTLHQNSDKYWIGGNDLTTEGVFAWIDGSDVTTDGWRPRQPDNTDGNEDCLQFIDLGMNDDICSDKQLFLCEKPLI